MEERGEEERETLCEGLVTVRAVGVHLGDVDGRVKQRDELRHEAHVQLQEACVVLGLYQPSDLGKTLRQQQKGHAGLAATVTPAATATQQQHNSNSSNNNNNSDSHRNSNDSAGHNALERAATYLGGAASKRRLRQELQAQHFEQLRGIACTTTAVLTIIVSSASSSTSSSCCNDNFNKKNNRKQTTKTATLLATHRCFEDEVGGDPQNEPLQRLEGDDDERRPRCGQQDELQQLQQRIRET
jgi:hypothetical protein